MSEVERLTASQRCAIETDCARLTVAYAHLVDRRRYAELVALFTEDGILERPGVRVQGTSELRKFFEARPADVATRHACAAPFFEQVTSARATSITYMTLFQCQGTDEGPNTVPGVAGLAEFHDIFVHTDHGWRIAHRVAKPVMVVK